MHFKLIIAFVEDSMTELLAPAGPNVVSEGIAIPHLHLEGLERSSCYLASVPGGTGLLGPDGREVDLIFLVLSRPDRALEHLTGMAAIARLVRDAGLVASLRRQRTRGRLFALLRERD